MVFTYNILWRIKPQPDPRKDPRYLIIGGEFFMATTDLEGEIDTQPEGITTLKGGTVGITYAGALSGINHRISNSIFIPQFEAGAISGHFMAYGLGPR